MLADVTPDELLVGPRGRDTCRALLRAAARQPVSAGADDAALAALADAVTMAMYWQELDEPDDAERLRPVAETLAGSPAVSWWADPFQPADQHVVVFDRGDGEQPARPTLSGLKDGLATLAAEHTRHSLPLVDDFGNEVDWRMISGFWWSAPIAHPGAHSTRCGADSAPLGMSHVEDFPGWERATSWPIRVTGAPRLLELAGPDDWTALVRAHPLDVSNTTKRGDWWRATGRDGGWLMPDWAAVGEQWDAAHLRITGYLTTAGRALDVGDGFATVLAGWDPDETFWFSDVVELVDAPTGWRREDETGWRRV
jgi:hypothetical protein